MRQQLHTRLVDLPRLRRAALRYARHGWSVTPGAVLTGDRYACDRPGCPTLACHPALACWQADASTERAQISQWWRRRPHTVLLATGGPLDVLDVPAYLGLWVLRLAKAHGQVLGPSRRRLRGPLAVTPTGRWMFLVEPGARLRPELDGHPDVLLHGAGSWVPAPPTRLPEGQVRWSIAPNEVEWRLPDPYALQALIADALTAVPTDTPTPPDTAGPADVDANAASRPVRATLAA
ncbi:bifunctional DNA primase/polymerase [Pilimelia columellifera]|uniref:DNA primase/polymerase bifunctional N-terminal domain-containing protein n=1 Tax=Pilimelia columellifera subsp. columellifera TaxID=706583 RepID=A0ABN3NGE2_9ACTN